MFYLLHGKDTLKGKQKLKELLVFFRSKVGNAGIFRIEEDGFNLAELEELLKSQMLFGDKHVVVCDRIFSNPTAKEFVRNNVEKIAGSRNAFIFFEEEVDEETFALLEKHAAKIQEFKPQLSGAEKQHNLFPICDAFSAKNKGKLWTLFQQALLSGVPAEEVFWKIWWQVKNLLLVKKLSELGEKKAQKESGLHPFVVKKTLSALRNFTEKELNDSALALVELYHNARRGDADFEVGLEKFLIK